MNITNNNTCKLLHNTAELTQQGAKCYVYPSVINMKILKNYTKLLVSTIAKKKFSNANEKCRLRLGLYS